MAFSVKYVYQIIDKFSGPAAKINAAAKTISGRMRNVTKSFRNASVTMEDLQNQMAKFAAVAATAFILAMPIKHAMAFEDAMADVAKVVDFSQPDGLRRMGDDILTLSKITPVAATELAAIAAVGGQMGIAEKDIVGFAETVSKMSVAFGLTADDVAVSMAKIANIFKIPASEFEKFADTINHISNNTVVSADEMLRALQNKGAAAGKQMGFTADQSAALAASFVATGVNAERVGSIMQGLGRGINEVSKTNKEFAAIAQREPIKALQALSKHFSSLDTVAKKTQMEDLFGIDFAGRIGEILDTMQGPDGVVNVMFDLAASQQKLGSVNKEFQTRINTSASKMQIMKNTVTALAIKIGAMLLPVVNLVFDGIVSIANAVDKFVDATGPLVPMILAATTALMVFKVAAIAAKLAQMALNIAMSANPIGLVIALVAALATWVIYAKDQFGSWTKAIIHVGRTLQRWALSPIRLLLYAFDKLTGASTLDAFDALSDKINGAIAGVVGFGEEFDAVVKKEKQIALAAEVASNRSGSASVIDAKSSDSKTDINLTVNDPGGIIQSVQSRTKGAANVKVGKNMGFAYGS